MRKTATMDKEREPDFWISCTEHKIRPMYSYDPHSIKRILLWRNKPVFSDGYYIGDRTFTSQNRPIVYCEDAKYMLGFPEDKVKPGQLVAIWLDGDWLWHQVVEEH